jgi:diguanylate cyclase (GGDEF)-like protein/PAS domain S-box-containing protein
MLNTHLFYVTFTLVTSVFMVGLASYALRQREKPGALWFALLCLSTFIWSVCGVAEVFVPRLEQKIFWSKLEYLGITTFPVFCLVFVSFFTGFIKKFDKQFLFSFTVPALTIGVAWTNELHHRFWTDISVSTGQLLGHPAYQHGWYFYLHTFYSYALCGLSFALVLWSYFNSQRGQQSQFRVLLASYFFPVAGSLGYLFDFIPFDATPIGFAVTSILFAWALFRHDFIAHLPLPYHQVFYHLDEAVVVLDHEEKLLEFNDKATLYFDLSEKDLRQPLAFPFLSELKRSGRLEQHVQQKNLALNLTRLGNGTNLRGYLLSARDITNEKKSEMMLEAQLEKLNALVITNDSLQHQSSREDVYREAVGVAFEMTHADVASLVLYDRRSDTLSVVASQQRQPRQDTSFVGKHLRRGEGLSWKALDTAKATFLKDLAGLQSSHADLEQATEWFGIPLLDAEGEPFGVFSVRINNPHKTLEASDRVFLEAIAQTCRNVLLRLGLIDFANAKASAYRELYTSAERQARELTLLDRVRTAIAKDLSPQQVLASTALAIHEVLGYPNIAIYLLEQDQLTAKSYLGYKETPTPLATNIGIVAKALRDKHVVFLENATLDATFRAALPNVQSALALPLFDSKGVVGILSLETPLGNPLTEADVKLMTALSEQVSFALERSKLYEDLRQREERLRLLAENTRDIIAWHDTQGLFLYVTPAVGRIFGYAPAEILGRRVSEYAHPDDVTYLRQTVLPSILHGEAFETNHYRVRHADGRYLWVETFIQPLFSEAGEVTGYVASSRDISERKRLQEQMLEGALLYDSLTNLPNRALFMDRLQHVAQRRDRGQNNFAVLFLDLDRFKIVNDSLGHTAGDKLLKGIAERLQQCVRPQDTIARLGGDEFAILLEDMNEAGAYAIAERIGITLKKPFDIDGRDVQSSVSIGITLSQDVDNPEQLLRNADVAMYHAKNNGRSRYALFNSAMHEKVLETMQLEVELRQALGRGEFRVHYQPITELKTGQLSGVEALVRWYHPTKGILAPTSFISIAEDAGMISQLDHWVLREATRQVKTWQVLYGRDLTVSVNLSTKNFRLSDLAQTILSTLEESQLSPSSLKLEITESVLMDNLETGLSQLQLLREAGVSLQIDDFGTGYSSLSYLHQLPLDSLKIDRSFVWKLDTVWKLGKPTSSKQVGNGGEIVQTIISLARSLNLSVVAEGVETEGQRAVLETLGCDYGQGFLFAKPLPAGELEGLLSVNRPLVLEA